jgi:hypothetical protein
MTFADHYLNVRNAGMRKERFHREPQNGLSANGLILFWPLSASAYSGSGGKDEDCSSQSENLLNY